MAYSAWIRAGIGAVRASLAASGVRRQDGRFAEHGEHRPDADAPLVLVACSGGRDSMALAALAATVCATLGVRCGAAVIDHGMQPGSADVAERAARRCRALGLDPVTVRAVEVTGDGRGAEAAARDARYRALGAIARESGAAVVLLAHTSDDQAETVLIGLLRSAGVDALAGMPEHFERGGVRYARPLLDLSRADTTGICEDLDLTWWDDPTNGDGVPASEDAGLPLRSRIRHQLMPFLRRFAGGDIVAHLAGGSRLLRLDKDYLDGQADAAVARIALEPDGDLLRMGVKALEREHPAIRLRVIAHLLASAGAGATSAQVASVERLVSDWHGQGPVSLPSGYSAFRQKHVIRVCQYGGHAYRRRSRSD
ncbi:MAG: tRNA lysidine(34) synthetase TilS [Bifidobacterium scardovii]|uniref:tRNA lysidine(34) synthetase TilS n=2 Tax=Bifidobacterium scardovii TaxID=158787 RepID=UPI000667F8ED|nr:tRNA lysidine(34) synthetase TilS [Bifidobacterium scardovii]MBS6947195.1 tRNA lysidine(34) synthetase TilS [Bifidobacterium scardovii]MDU3737056.1 tRNA lysidine(34) synthetase TilS [Bifidobacterium scardovii]MDU5297676.1 tRNA lysidine(34) synthetase TilS [Bifidobacterium scardovii]MDU5611842.1 tRNA lysidine(34) synthetase TilS [Bifidobacterium scardovii]MDU5887050.1 tRNA lysidine(34) synthetase TilS [Bifidobacterium scardovii]